MEKAGENEPMDLKEMLEAAKKATMKAMAPKREKRSRKPKSPAVESRPKRKYKPRVTKKVRGKQYRVDLGGNPIVSFNSKPTNRLCLRCTKTCKQRGDVKVIICPYFQRKEGAEDA